MSKEVMEVARAAVKASTALNSVVELIPDAIELHPSLAKVLQSYGMEAKKSQAVVDLIRKEKGLQTSGVVAAVRMLESLGNDLQDDITSLGVDKDKFALDKVVEKLKGKRQSLILQIQLASVGLSKCDDKIIIDTKLVNSANEAIKKSLPSGSRLDIALFIAKLKRNPDAKGRIYLSNNEYEELTRRQIKAAHPETKTLSQDAKVRIVCNCLARGQSIQILGPVAVDLWPNMALVKIEHLESTDEAIQLAYPVTMEVLREVLGTQDKRILARRTRE